MPDTIDILKHEFSGEPGSFLLQLRIDLVWDQQAFSRLTGAMLDHVRSLEDRETIPRWIADGFWYCESFVHDWSTHPNFPRKHSPEYYDAAYERLHNLAYWLFVGECPYKDETGFKPI